MKKHKLKRPNSLVNDAWLQLGDLHGVEIENPLLNRSQENIENPGLLEVSLMKDPRYLSFAAKVLLGIDLLPEQAVIMEELWNRPFPMYIASRGFGKSFLLAMYATLKCVLVPGTKVVGTGAAFRQSRVIWEYMCKIWRDAPVLQSICTRESGPRTQIDRVEVRINDSVATFVPLGDGQKIRGLRANVIIADEFASIPPEVYETVVGGFASVSQKPIDNVKEFSRKKALQDLGQWTDHEEKRFSGGNGNQNIISGTADYDFMHFAEYWRRYFVYIKSGGDPKKPVKMPNGEMKYLGDYFDDNGVPESFDHRDYSIIRIPYEKIPKGFMDDKIVARAKATVHKSIYLREYGACFPSDSDGFFKRTLIESCVANQRNLDKETWPSWCPSCFDPMLRGSPDKKYVIAIDPAAYRDNFAIVILELWPEHSRVVYCWSTNLKDFKARKSAGIIKENDYYSFCARRIRNLAKVFPTEDVVIDAQGGGLSVVEALHDKNNLQEGEVPWWPTNRIMAPDKALDTDGEAGRHIIHMFQFAKYDHVSEANNGTRKDLEDRVLLFPRFDTVQLELSAVKDAELAKRLKVKRIFDTLEDAVMDIEALKDELCTIQVTRTGTGVQGRERFDTPETTTAEGKKTRMRKDRYSAFVMANFIARNIQRAPAAVEYNVIGGFAHTLNEEAVEDEDMYIGPSWFTESSNYF